MHDQSINTHEQTLKWCGGCESFKPPSEFYKKTMSADGRSSRCKTCTRAYQDEYRKNAVNKRRDEYLRSHYGIETEQYDKMRWDQNGLCAICGEAGTEVRGQRLHVDHDHATGKVRALLCSACNVGLGSFKDNPQRLRKAVEYLKKWN